MTDKVGTIKWEIYDTATSQMVFNSIGENIIFANDIQIRRIGPKKNLHCKEIKLADHFTFGIADNVDRDKRKSEGFALTGSRENVATMAWDWFVIDGNCHANKLQEVGELSFDTRPTANGTEINHMEFLTDVSIRIFHKSKLQPFKPAWRIKIFKGSAIHWPASD